MANIPPLPPSAAGISAMLQALATTGEPVVLAAAIQSLPEKFASLTRPVQVNGFPLAVTENGLVSLRTSAGDLLLQLMKPPDTAAASLKELITPFIQNQKPVALMLHPGNPPTEALATLPPLNAALTSPSAAQGAAQPLGITATPQHPPLVLGETVTATVLPQDIGGSLASSLGAETLNRLGSASFAGKLLAQTSSSSSITGWSRFFAAPLNMDALGGFLKNASVSSLKDALKSFIADTRTDAPAPPFSATEAGKAAASPYDALKPGMEYRIRVDAFLRSGETALPLETPDKIIATVTGKGPDGQLVINAGGKSLYIREVSDAPVGSRLRITLLPPLAEHSAMPQQAAGHESHALYRLVAALAEIQPQLARQILQNVMPQPNAQLPSALLFFFNALNQGGVSAWLGSETIERLARANKLDLVAGLADEMQAAMGAARDPAVGQWRSWPLPIYDGQQFQLLYLYVRRDRDRKHEGEGYPVSPQTRFIVTMNMTRLGPMQVDGLSQKKQLDLVLRSERPLPAHLPNELRATYIKTMEALGLAGSLHFQTGKQNWVAVQRVAESAGMVT